MANNTTNKGKLGKKVTISAPIEEEGSDGADEPGLTADGEQVRLSKIQVSVFVVRGLWGEEVVV